MRSGAFNNGVFSVLSVRGYIYSSSASSEYWNGGKGLGAWYFRLEDLRVSPSTGPEQRWRGHSLRYLDSGGGGRVYGHVDHMTEILIHPWYEEEILQDRYSPKFYLRQYLINNQPYCHYPTSDHQK